MTAPELTSLADVLHPQAPIADVDKYLDGQADYIEGAGGPVDIHGVGQAGPARPLWTPPDRGAADWAMSQMAAVQQQAVGISEQARLWHQQITAWEEDALRAPLRRLEFFDGALTRWAEAEREADPKLRTLYLPSGTVACTVPTKPSIVITDEAAAIGYLNSDKAPDGLAADALRVEARVLVSEARRHLRIDSGKVIDKKGHEAPGFSAQQPGPPSYRVKPTQPM